MISVTLILIVPYIYICTQPHHFDMDRGLCGRSSRESRGLTAFFLSVAGADNSNSMCSSSSISTYHSRNRISDIAISSSLSMRVNRPYGQLHGKCAVCSAKHFSSVAAVRVCL